METTSHIIDLEQHERAVPNPRPGNLDDCPHDIIQKAPGDIWLVSHSPIYMDRPITWYNHRKGEHVVIPLFPYLLAPDPALAMGYMLQLGMRCSFDVGRPVRLLHLSIGSPVNQLTSGDGWQFWAGFGLVVQ